MRLVTGRAHPESVEMVEVDDLGRLHLENHGLTTSSLDILLRTSGWGHLVDDAHAALHISRLHATAHPVDRDRDWDARWATMLSYAAAHDWLTDSGTAVQVHITSPTVAVDHRATPSRETGVTS